METVTFENERLECEIQVVIDRPGDKWVAKEVIWLDCYEVWRWSEVRFRCVVDVGAHVGSFSLLARRCWPESVQYAIEPNPAAMPALVANTAGYCAVRAVAISSDPNVKYFEPVDGLPGSGFTSRPDDASRIEAKIKLDGFGFRELPDNIKVEHPGKIEEYVSHRSPWLLKLDCEGAELDICRYIASDECKNRPSVIVGEYHSGLAELVGALGNGKHYLIDQIPTRHGTPHRDPTKPLGLFRAELRQ